MARPRLLDLFCCAGGAGMGYHRAGFDVVGVDIKPQPRYPFEFINADVLGISPRWIADNFDAVHASPPCQGYSAARFSPNTVGAPLLIDATRDLLNASGLPWAIENVEGARSAMRDPIMLCGTAFGLGAAGHELRRHRLFESNIDLDAPACQHTAKPVVGVYGGHPRCRSAKHGGRGTADFVGQDKPAIARECMGIDWMTMVQMSEAIPPAYTEFLGLQLIAHLQQREVA